MLEQILGRLEDFLGLKSLQAKTFLEQSFNNPSVSRARDCNLEMDEHLVKTFQIGPAKQSAVEKPTICKREMGNKNKNNSRNSTHRHVFCKNVFPGMKKTQKKSSIKCTTDKTGSQKEGKAITFEGSMIINLDKLQ